MNLAVVFLKIKVGYSFVIGLYLRWFCLLSWGKYLALGAYIEVSYFCLNRKLTLNQEIFIHFFYFTFSFVAGAEPGFCGSWFVSEILTSICFFIRVFMNVC